MAALGFATSLQRLSAAMMALVAAGQLGCTSMVGAPSGVLGPPADVGRAMLIVDTAPLTVEAVNIPRGKGDAAESGAARFFLQCAGAAGHAGGTFAGAAAIVWLAGCALGTPIAAGVAASNAESADDVARSTAVVNDAIALDRMAGELQRALEESASTTAPGRLIVAPGSAKADTELRIVVSKMALRGDGTPDGPVRFEFTVDTSVVAIRERTALRSTRISYTSEARRLREWAGGGGQAVNDSVTRAMSRLAESATDFAFLLYPFPYVGQPHAATWFTGLQAEYPARAGDFFDPLWATVDSPRPTFRWQAFPRDVDRAADPASMARVTGVTYDLLIAEEDSGGAGAVIYRRSALPSNAHELETALAPGRRYFWTVRARFDLDGRAFVTEWAERGSLPVTMPTRARQSHVVPSHLGYPFKTKWPK